VLLTQNFLKKGAGSAPKSEPDQKAAKAPSSKGDEKAAVAPADDQKVSKNAQKKLASGKGPKAPKDANR
jgi:hypothetical protein